MRDNSYGQTASLSFLSRFGLWLSVHQISRALRNGKRTGHLLDLGAGFNMLISARLQHIYKITCVDVALNQEIEPNIQKVTGNILHVTTTLPSDAYEVILFNNVLEHLTDSLGALQECYRLLAPNGMMLLNVPSWWGKFFLEYQAFKMNDADARYEMNDHKTYYDKRDLWPLLVKAGFLPESIKLRYHKLGLNLFAVCGKKIE